MIKNSTKKIRKGLKKMVDERVTVCKEILSSAQNRLIVGLIIVGLGSGFIISAYIKAPER